MDSLYAIGECANVSVHGANRLGSHSLLDLVVFGRAAGLHAEKSILEGLILHGASATDIKKSLARVERWNSTQQGEDPITLYHEMQKVMQNDFSVFRQEEQMVDGLKKFEKLRQQLSCAALKDDTKIFNTACIQALEIDNLMVVAYVTAVSALTRKESRGAHCREDYPKRDDKHWLKHLLCFADGQVRYRAVNMKLTLVEAFLLEERVY